MRDGRGRRCRCAPAAVRSTPRPHDALDAELGRPRPSPASLPITTGDEWSLSHRQLALIAKRPVRVCFDVGERDAASGGAIDWGVARVTVAGTSISRKVFTPTSAWTTQCPESFAPSSADAIPSVGTTNVSVFPAYLVDNLRVEVTSAPVATAWREASGAAASSCGLAPTASTSSATPATTRSARSRSPRAIASRRASTIRRRRPTSPAAPASASASSASAYVGNEVNDKISLNKVEQIP